MQATRCPREVEGGRLRPELHEDNRPSTQTQLRCSARLPQSDVKDLDVDDADMVSNIDGESLDDSDYDYIEV